MTERQKRFSEHYAASANATQSAIAAGYSERSAYSDGQRLLKNAEIQKYISSITAPAQGERIATAEEIQSLWTSLLRDENTRTCDRLTASKLLYAAQAGAAQATGNDDNIFDADSATEEESGVRISLPFNFRDANVEIGGIRYGDDILPIPGHADSDVVIYILPEDVQRFQIFKATNGEIDIADYPEEKQVEIIKKFKSGELIHDGK